MNKTFETLSKGGRVAESEAQALMETGLAASSLPGTEGSPAETDVQRLPLAVVHYLVGRRSQEPSGTYVVSPQERQRMIAEAAYFRAQARGFGEDLQLEDWLAAERDIQQQLEASQVRDDRPGQPLKMSSRKPARRDHVPSNLGMAERRSQPEGQHEPERRRRYSLAQPAVR